MSAVHSKLSQNEDNLAVLVSYLKRFLTALQALSLRKQAVPSGSSRMAGGSGVSLLRSKKKNAPETTAHVGTPPRLEERLKEDDYASGPLDLQKQAQNKTFKQKSAVRTRAEGRRGKLRTRALGSRCCATARRAAQPAHAFLCWISPHASFRGSRTFDSINLPGKSRQKCSQKLARRTI